MLLFGRSGLPARCVTLSVRLSPQIKQLIFPKRQMHRECGLQNSRGFSPLRFPDCFRRVHTNTAFLHEPLNYMLREYVKQNALPLYRDCVICFSQIYDRELPQRRIRDYDNLEFKQILDTLCTYVLTDDSGFFCDSYYTTQLGLKDCTLVSVMEKADFPKWLQNQKNHHESMSENLLTSQAEIRHR